MNTYVDWKILGSLRISPLGIDDFSIDKFVSMFDKKSGMEIDPFSNSPLYTRKSPSRHLLFEYDLDDKKMWEDLYFVTMVMLRLLQEEKVESDVILYYRYEIQHFNIEVTCAAFKFDTQVITNG